MVDIEDIPDFPGRPGQRPEWAAPPGVSPVSVVLVTAPLDRDYRNVALNAAAVDAFIDAEVAAGRAKSVTVERWAPWSPFTIQLGITSASQYNYARFTIDGQNWYAFINAEYLNLTDTVYEVTPDHWTTYSPEVGYSMVARGHIAVAASQSDTYGDLYLTAPEPISAEPVRGILETDLLGSTPGGWTVMVTSVNDLRGRSIGVKPFWERHSQADNIANAGNLASSATVDSDGVVQTDVPDSSYPWNANTSDGASGTLIDNISPGHTVTNPGGTFASGWEWHVSTAFGRGGVDLNYNFQEFLAPGNGTVDHFDVPGVGMVVRLTLDVPANRVEPQEPSGFDQFGPIVAIWFEHCSAAYDGHVSQGDPIGISGDGYGEYAPHLHVHAQINHANVSGNTVRAQFFSFTGGFDPSGVDVYVPAVFDSPVSTIDGVAAGGGVYLFTPAGFAEYMTIMQGAPWTTAAITDIRLVPAWAISGGGDAVYTPQTPSRNPADGTWEEARSIPIFRSEVVSATAFPVVLDDWRTTVLNELDAGIYRKILTSPFTDLLVGNGDTLQSFRPDQWHASGLAFQAVTGAAHGDPSIRLIPTDYNELGAQMGIDAPVGGHAGLARTGYGMAASQVANNDLAPWLAAYSSHQTWTANLRNKELAVALGLTKIQLDAGIQGINTVLGAVTGGAGGAIGGGKAAISGAAGGGLAAIGGLATANLQASNTITMLDISTDGSFDIGAFQLGLASVASVSTFNTWVQSLSSVPGSGVAHTLASAWRAIVGQAFQAIIAVPSAERVKTLLSEWRRFGYMIGQAFTPPRLDVMTHWSYWQLESPTLLGALPPITRDVISAAFERGVTVWTSIAEIGTEPDNQPVAGIMY